MLWWNKLSTKSNLILGSVLILAFLLRILNLTALPIFTDEAIYIRWTQIANGDPAWRFISLTDGKQPLFIWLNMIAQRIFADPLFAGRLVSVVGGCLTTLGLYFLGKELFSVRVGLLASLVWAVLPFGLWHDRLALMDSLLACFTVWSLWLQVLLARKLRTDIALFLGMVMGGGLLTKSSAQFFIYLIPFSLLLVKKPVKKDFFYKWVGLSLLSVFIAQLINSVQRLSPFYYLVGQKNLTFIYTSSELLSFTLFQHWQRFWGNLTSLSSWTISYFTISFLIMILLAIIQYKDKLREKLLLVSWFLFPFLALAFFGKVIYPRFVLFMAMPLVVFVAIGIDTIRKISKSKLLLSIFCLLIFSYPLYFDYQITFNPINAFLPENDRNQYIDQWPAGWGIKEVVNFLNEESKKGKIAVGTEGTFGLTPAALEIYLHNNKNIEIQGFWPISDGISRLVKKSEEKPTYVLFKDTQVPDPSWPLELVLKYKRGKGNNYLTLYRVKK